MTTIVGIDLSLTGTGVATITNGDITTHVYGSKPAGDLIPARAERLTNLAQRIVDATHWADLVIVERPAYSKAVGSATDRAALWWFTVGRLVLAHQVPVVDVTIQHIKTYATGKGNASKDEVLAETVRRYGHLAPDLATNDEADALQAALLGWHRYRGHSLVALPQGHARAVEAVKWPPYTPRAH